jgi:nitrite reductase (NADH) large subunit
MRDRTLVVVGNGMVGQRLIEVLRGRWAGSGWRAVVFGEERWPAYDRVHLSTYVDGATADDLSLVTPEAASDPLIEVVLGDRVVTIDRERRLVCSATGREVAYDALVLATGSNPFVPPVPGHDLPGCFVYRTLDDLDSIRAWSSKARSGVVVGGGLLGLEAANALRALGVTATVVELAPHLMPQQLDPLSGGVLGERVAGLGIGVEVGGGLAGIAGDGQGGVCGVELSDGTVIDAGLVVFAAGVRPRDDLGRACGLAVGERGGIVVDDACRTDDPAVWAIGECVSHRGRVFGLVAPGYEMAEVVAGRLLGGDATFEGSEPATRLKLLGVDVAVFGDVHAATAGAQVVTYHDPFGGVVKRAVVDAAGATLLGGSFVGDAEGYLGLLQQYRSGTALPDRLDRLLAGASASDASVGDADSLVCSCNNVTRSTIAERVGSGGCALPDVQASTRAGTTCGSCVPLVRAIIDHELEQAGVVVDRSLCEHFRYTRQEVFDLVRVHRIQTFGELLEGWGRGAGCEICRPAVASMLASLWSEHPLDRRHVALQDTNDRFLANIQRDGTYSVVPRVPGGEITPDKLIALGEVARDFDLYVKITGGQRIDLLGARVDQLPEVWRRLVDAGFESGHAYGKALRTVKSCVGTTWCRYGVQDSTSLAIDLELRYRGLRSPHKLKSAVSGCARECAEAQSKDFGVIATEKGWNLYVGGNGGMRPRHADLLVEGVDTATLIRYLDRFLMFYIRTAERLERTSTWIEKMDGGVDHVRSVVVDDSLGIAAELEADMAASLARYECEWRATLDAPEQLERFTHFVNDPTPDPAISRRDERGQRVPALAPVPGDTGALVLPPTPVPVAIGGRSR